MAQIDVGYTDQGLTVMTIAHKEGVLQVPLLRHEVANLIKHLEHAREITANRYTTGIVLPVDARKV